MKLTTEELADLQNRAAYDGESRGYNRGLKECERVEQMYTTEVSSMRAEIKRLCEKLGEAERRYTALLRETGPADE